jgi:hypothetical protein
LTGGDPQRDLLLFRQENRGTGHQRPESRVSTPRLFSEKVVAKLGREGLMSKIISEMKQFPETSFSNVTLYHGRNDCF